MSDKKKKKPLITPRTLKGFRDFLPETMLPREAMSDAARRVFRSFGYSPIDTPALEYLEILLGKGSEETDKQLYQFTDHGGREVGLRFDLTVPFARFAAQHIGNLGTPFKRYHLGKVWRGENTQAGRFREFMQCDFDIIATRSVQADIEIGLVIHELLMALGIERFKIRLNNRKILGGLLEKLQLAEKATPVLRALDKLGKIGAEAVAREMAETAGTSEEQSSAVLKLAEMTGDHEEIFGQLRALLEGSPLGVEGLAELEAVLVGMQAGGVPRERIALDVSIARGLDYYTGTIYETFLDDLPGIGSICSGGRYDNLAGLYTKQELPGVGASLGLDRLTAALEELDLLEKIQTPAPVLIPLFDKQLANNYLAMAAAIRRSGIGVEVYPEAKKLGQQLKYADRRGFRFALIQGSQEAETHECQVKDLADGESETVSTEPSFEPLIEYLRAKLV